MLSTCVDSPENPTPQLPPTHVDRLRCRRGVRPAAGSEGWEPVFPAVSGGARSGARSEATSSDEGAVERWYTSLDSMPCNGRFSTAPPDGERE